MSCLLSVVHATQASKREAYPSMTAAHVMEMTMFSIFTCYRHKLIAATCFCRAGRKRAKRREQRQAREVQGAVMVTPREGASVHALGKSSQHNSSPTLLVLLSLYTSKSPCNSHPPFSSPIAPKSAFAHRLNFTPLQAPPRRPPRSISSHVQLQSGFW